MVMLKMKIYTKSSKKNIMSMVTILESVYKDAKCGLDYNSPFSLVISLILLHNVLMHVLMLFVLFCLVNILML